MLKRDSLTAQMQQLSHTLAKVKRLIVEGEIVEADDTIESILIDYYGTTVDELVKMPTVALEQSIHKQQFAPEELTRLADFIDLRAQSSTDFAVQRALWERVICLYDVLETTHHTVSFDHILRRTAIQQLLHT